MPPGSTPTTGWGSHLIGKASEVVVDLDFEAGEVSGVLSEPIAPLLLQGIDLLAQARGDLVRDGGRQPGCGSASQ